MAATSRDTRNRLNFIGQSSFLFESGKYFRLVKIIQRVSYLVKYFFVNIEPYFVIRLIRNVYAFPEKYGRISDLHQNYST